MKTYSEFLKNHIVIKELKEQKPNGKIYYKAMYDGVDYCITATTMEAMTWKVKRMWTSTIARTYHDDKGKWWVGEKGSRKGFKSEEDAIKHQAKLIAKYS